MEQASRKRAKQDQMMRTFLLDIDDLHEAKRDAEARSGNAYEWRRHPDYIAELECFAKKYAPKVI